MNNSKLFLIDGHNNNKVIGGFETKKEVEEYLNGKEFTENWENVSDTFQDFKDNFTTVTGEEMEDAVYKNGGRMKNYWT